MAGELHTTGDTSPFSKYASTLWRLYGERRVRTLTMEEEHGYACRLEEAWKGLSEAQRQFFEELTEVIKSIR